MRKPSKPSPTESPLRFEIDPETLTALGGMPLVVETFRSLELPESVKGQVRVKERDRGYDETTCVESFVILNAAGGECVEDFRRLREDAGLAEMIGHDLPSPEAALQFLYGFHEDEKIEEAQQRRLPGRGFVPSEKSEKKDTQPLLDEPRPAFGAAMMKRPYTRPRTQAWAAKIASFDGYVFVTPEYNHGLSGALTNAIDYLYPEWNNKAAGLVGYGGSGATRSIEQLRLVLAELQVATVRVELNLSLVTDFENRTTFKPAPAHEQRVNMMLDQVIAWSEALKTLRSK